MQLSRPGAACGALFAIVLAVAAGDGGFSPARAVLGGVALSLAAPFIGMLGRVLRGASPQDGWLADTAVIAGVAGITLKIASGVPEAAVYREHVASGTQLYDVLTALAAAATVAALFPLAVFCAATAVVALRSHVLPTWLGVGAALTAAALAVNGAFLSSSFVPALLVFLLWILLTSIYLISRRTPRPAQVGEPRPAMDTRSSKG
jgi:hypothetical protein